MNKRLLAIYLTLGFATAADWRAHASGEALEPSECDSIDSVPMRFDIDYDADVQPLFVQQCSNCHVDSGGAPLAGLELDVGVSWFQLVGTPSSQDPSLTRVIPGDAAQSLLYQKVNCTFPAIGSRMPFCLLYTSPSPRDS